MAQITKRETAGGKVRWGMRVFIGRDAKGKRKFVNRTYATKREATEEARRLERLKDTGGLSAPSRQPFGAYLEAWLDSRKGQVRERSLHEYRGLVKRYITDAPPDAPPLAAVRLDRVSHEALETLYGWMYDQGKSPTTIGHISTVLSMACKAAVKRKLIPSNPATLAEKPTRRHDGQEEKPPPKHMSREEAGRFLQAAREDRYSALWHVLLTGGLRPSEAMALGWEHVDFDTGRVEVERSLTRIGVEGGGWKLVPPKTRSSRRSVPLPAITMDELRRWKATQGRERLQLGAEWQDHGFVFTATFGQPLQWTWISSGAWRSVMARAGLGEWVRDENDRTYKVYGTPKFRPAFHPYCLRHTCATLLLEDGEQLKAVSERLGHKSIAITGDVYSHATRRMQESAASRMDAMFGAAAATGK